MPELPMRFHLLAPDVRCPSCGGGLTFIRVRRYADLYQCASDPCKCQVMPKEAKTCGYAALSPDGGLGKWTACGGGPAQGE